MFVFMRRRPCLMRITAVIQMALHHTCSILVCAQLVRRLFMWMPLLSSLLPSLAPLELLRAASPGGPPARLSQTDGYQGCAQLCHNCPPHELTTAVISHTKPD